MNRPAETKVWDLFVRLFHWAVAIAFVVAFLTEDDTITIHVWAGYLIGTLLVLRIIWGIVGPRHARFVDFIYKPTTVLSYLVRLVAGGAKRYLGHSPAGGAMVILLIVALAATVTTGLITYGEEGHGPLASVVASDQATEPGRHVRSPTRGLHELFANLTLALVIAHLAGVVLASYAHRENLARAMVTGRKRAE